LKQLYFNRSRVQCKPVCLL